MAEAPAAAKRAGAKLPDLASSRPSPDYALALGNPDCKDICIHESRPKAVYKKKKHRHYQTRWLHNSSSSISRAALTTEVGRMRKRDPEPRTPTVAPAKPVHVTPSRSGAPPQKWGKYSGVHLCLPTTKAQGTAPSPMISGGGTDLPASWKDTGAGTTDSGYHGDGTTAKATVKAFPQMKCTVLDLPEVIRTIPADGVVNYVGGDMFKFIPPAQVVLLKMVLHHCSDGDCVKILSNCRKAIPSREEGGNVLIGDIVLDPAASGPMFETHLLMDVCMMLIKGGRQRDENDWHEIFMKAGFSDYKLGDLEPETMMIGVGLKPEGSRKGLASSAASTSVADGPRVTRIRQRRTK
ncbi:hypothetical protein C2845_PM18G05280 [Panicum miliaceum]|uniref:O-methyltransferase C-terminal domain-containing protein n=1 Tax=Panicum miliaceum TaxID=4540 RepID=A0A3L6PIK2_PANMI|nr:hypothetical protein C2845_PM18G05280 [Panicum miliaceum]